MNKKLFTTLSEVKTLLGITGSDLDGALSMYLQAACNNVCSILGAHELLRFEVSEEEVKRQAEDFLTVKHLPIDWAEDAPTLVTVKSANGVVLDDVFFADIGELRTIRRKDSSGNRMIFTGDYYRVSYTAGFSDIAAVPLELKMLAAMICQAAVLKVDRSSMGRAGGNSKENPGQIKKYAIGAKTVEYFDPNMKGGASGFGAGIDFGKTVEEWAGRFKTFKGYS